MDTKNDSSPNQFESDLIHRQLLHEQKRYEELFDSAPDGYILTNAAGEITRCNEAASSLLDAARAHLIGESIVSFIALEDRLIIKEHIDACITGRGTQRFEAQIQTGSERLIHTFITLNCPGLSDTDINELHWRIQDISVRINAEEKHSQLRAIVALSSDAVIETSANGAITNWNDGAEFLFGHSESDMIGQSILTLVSEATKAELFDFFNKNKRQEIELDFPIVTKDFINKHVKMKVTSVKNRKGKVSNCSAVFRDITSEMQNEHDLRFYLTRLVDIQEKERARIAQELHDGTGQHLAAVGLALGAIINNYDQTVPLEKKLQNLQGMLTELGREIHNVAWELRPPSLDKHGLVPALKHYTEIWSERTGIHVEFLATGVESNRASSTIETALFRIVQESFTNISKHANASKVNVILQQHKNEIHLVVEDNGEGFTTENDRDSSGQSMGLSGMKERANLAGGNFQIESSHGHGTAIFVRVPFEKRD